MFYAMENMTEEQKSHIEQHVTKIAREILLQVYEHINPKIEGAINDALSQKHGLICLLNKK